MAVIYTLMGVVYTPVIDPVRGIVLRKAARKRVASPGQMSLFGSNDPKEGDTKVENGVTYRLNQHSRWERADKAKGKAKPKAVVPVVEEKAPAKAEVNPVEAVVDQPKPRRQRTSKPYLEDQDPSTLAEELDKIEQFLATVDAGLVKITPRKRKQTETYMKQVKDALFEITKSDNDSDFEGMSVDDILDELGVEDLDQPEASPEPTIGDMLAEQKAQEEGGMEKIISQVNSLGWWQDTGEDTGYTYDPKLIEIRDGYRVACLECNNWVSSSNLERMIKHSRNCQSEPQPVPPPPVPKPKPIKKNNFAEVAKAHRRGANVDPNDIYEAYRAGHLSASEAMNSDF